MSPRTLRVGKEIIIYTFYSCARLWYMHNAVLLSGEVLSVFWLKSHDS